jgi:hypothetical protein
MSNWKINRDRLAPSAARIAISFSREDARASSMLATLAHAISSNRPTAAASVYRVFLKGPTTWST